jgi:hypothetical protein
MKRRAERDGEREAGCPVSLNGDIGFIVDEVLSPRFETA